LEGKVTAEVSAYYRIIAYLMRAFLLLCLLLTVAILASWLAAGALPPEWWVAPVIGIPIGIVLWWGSGLVLRIVRRN